VGALEAPVTFGLTGHQLSREGLLAVGAHDLVRRLRGGHLGHRATLPVLGQVDAVVVERRPFRRLRIAAGRPEVDQGEEPLAVG
jgi:hypothetical protein